MVSLSLDRYHFLFLDDFEGNANISVAVKSGSTVFNLLILKWIKLLKNLEIFGMW